MTPERGVKILELGLLAALATISGSMTSVVNFGCSVGLCCDEEGHCSTWDNEAGCGLKMSLDSIVTDSFFNGIKKDTNSSCPGKNFYTRSAFLNASSSYPAFGTTGSHDVSLREIAALFAHFTHETGSFCYIEEENGASSNYCDASSTQWPCNPNKKYYGRGIFQITWNFNYGPAGQSIGFDGLNFPETVISDPVINFKTAFWFWMNNIHSIVTSGQGFGATIRAINAIECDGGSPAAVRQRVKYYTNYCQQLGVSPGVGLSC